MSLLDWLTDGIGSSMGGSSAPMVDATNNYASPGSAPLSPDEMSPTMPSPPPVPTPPQVPQAPLVPNTPPVDPSTTDIADGMHGAGAGAPPVPLPTPGPAAADAGPAAIPPAAAPISGPGTPPGPPTSITPPVPAPDSSPAAPAVGVPGPNAVNPPATGFLGRALGLDANRERQVRGGLSAGLKAAAENSSKPGLAAFAGSAGAAMEGGQKASDTGYDQRIKALTLAVSAQQAGDKAAYNKNYAEYLKGKLAADDKSSASKKSSAWNKPDSQKFIDAMNAMAKDREIIASQHEVDQIAKTDVNGTSLVDLDGKPSLYAQAKARQAALMQQKQAVYLTGVGLHRRRSRQTLLTRRAPPKTPTSSPAKRTSIRM